MSIIAGLTGPTGAGKSRASEAARKMGVKVIDCDKLARVAVLPETPGLKSLVEAFGDSILNPDGTLNRREMAKLAFSTEENTGKLNRVLLPHISQLVKKELDAPAILLDAPTLFESGLDSICDTTVAVLADCSIRQRRIMERDGLTVNEAQQRMSAGKPDIFYIERAAHIIYNNDGPCSFDYEAAGLFKIIYGGN